MNKTIIISGLAIIIIAIVFILNKKENKIEIKYKEMTFSEMKEKIESGVDYTIVDVRTKEEYETGKILNAINIPLDKINEIENIEKDKNKYLFVYCRSGNRSTYAVNELNKMGYTNAYNVGGIIYYNK